MRPADERSSRALYPTLALLILVLAAWCAFSLLPVVGRRLGMTDTGRWFIDSYAVLAASDAARAGLDPYQPNPLDLFHRPHSYTHWWYWLGNFGLTREDNFLMGGTWVLVFLLLAVALLRPRTMGEAVIGGVALLSPPVLLAVNRANNDLVVFILLAAGLIFLREAKPWRLALFILMLVLATGLKFYPIIAGVALLLVRPSRRGVTATSVALLVAGLTLASLWADLKRAVIPSPVEGYTFGAPILFRALGWTGPLALLTGIGLLGLAAAVCYRRNWAIRLDEAPDELRARIAFAVGATLLVGCFLAGISHSYRLVFVIFLLPWLWQRISTPAGRLTGLLLVAALWSEGLYCLGTNVLAGPMPMARLVQQQQICRFVTQSFVWAAMAVLAGSLLGLFLAIIPGRQKGDGP